jgi:glycosyltransferase involved in cell wall biosynthesis
MPSCACIIPFYNEENRILSVLEQLLKIEEFDEFILVND